MLVNLPSGDNRTIVWTLAILPAYRGLQSTCLEELKLIGLRRQRTNVRRDQTAEAPRTIITRRARAFRTSVSALKIRLVSAIIRSSFPSLSQAFGRRNFRESWFFLRSLEVKKGASN